MTRKKFYVFPIGMVEADLLSREEFDRIVEEGRAKGHTHCQFFRIGYSNRVEAFGSVAYRNISDNLEGHSVYFARTGFPVYANYNRFRYAPDVVGVTEKENNSFGRGFYRFIMN